MGQPNFKQQQMQIQKAYTEVMPTKVFKEIKEDCKDSFENIKVDGIDQGYIWARTFIPSWLMGIIILIGAYVVLSNTLQKFGINIKLMQVQKSKGNENV